MRAVDRDRHGAGALDRHSVTTPAGADAQHQTHLTDRVPVLLGDSAFARDLRREIQTVAAVNVTVLIEGAVGTGKTLVARAIHHASRRSSGPFVTAVCASVDPSTAPSTFFGHRRGAFRGADHDHAGLFEAADPGTLLLQSIGDMPLNVQGLLLRVVEERGVRPLGEGVLRTVDVRLLATTDRDLAPEIAAGQFRADLFYRICVCRLRLARLESRREDIPLLANAFRSHACEAYGRRVDRISPDALRHLTTRSWPGNIAELKAAVEAAVCRSTGTALELEDFRNHVNE
jgi:two-component system, NtrC family, response regulator GlrR